MNVAVVRKLGFIDTSLSRSHGSDTTSPSTLLPLPTIRLGTSDTHSPPRWNISGLKMPNGMRDTLGGKGTVPVVRTGGTKEFVSAKLYRV
jgi:hypothetical protein